VQAPPPAGGGVDISGPCDEPEHVDDPRCTGAAPADDDNSGPGNADDRHDDDDNSGPSENRGPGNDEDDDE
jgi:hypothetical protein